MSLLRSDGKLGFVYVYECVGIDGKIKWTAREENLIPDVGRDYILDAALNGGAQLSTWYIGLYEANRTPVVSDTMATFMVDCQEITAYTSSGNLRLRLMSDPLSNGVWSNFGNKAEFVFTSTKNVYGGFISSNAVRGSSSGLLLSAVRNSTPKPVEAGEILRVTAGLSVTTI